jgi:hypothetical protein
MRTLPSCFGRRKPPRSDWTLIEWTSVLAREIAESRTRLGIVLLRDCEAPELLRLKHRIDARIDQEKARRETVEWVKCLRDRRRLAETTARVAFLPDPPQDFVGRAEALEMLYATLAGIQAEPCSTASRAAGSPCSRSTSLAVRRCCGCWIAIGSVSSCTPCCGKSMQQMEVDRLNAQAAHGRVQSNLGYGDSSVPDLRCSMANNLSYSSLWECGRYLPKPWLSRR